jgi:RND family efflux transporter MFP subunit
MLKFISLHYFMSSDENNRKVILSCENYIHYSKIVSGEMIMNKPNKYQPADEYFAHKSHISTKEDISRTTVPLQEMQAQELSNATDLQVLQPHTPPIKQPVKTHFPSKRTLLKIGIPLALLLILGLVSKAIYDTFAFQNVMAFRVGAQQMVPVSIGGGGTVFPRQQIPISYAAAGRVVAVLAQVGDQVKANQPLIKLDQSQIDAQHTLASNNVAAAQAYLNSVTNALPYSAVAIANAQQRLDTAKNQLNALKAKSLNNGELVAPTAGIISAINVTPGQNFSARKPLLTLIDPSIVTVHAQIPLQDLTHIRKGMSVQVNPSSLPDENLPGTVTSIVPQANPQTDTFEVHIQIDNTQGKLLPNMSAFVRIQGQIKAFVVPQAAVLNPDHESAVFKVRNNRADLTHVHIVGRSNNSLYLDAGVSPQDLIILPPLNHIRQGQSVNVTHLKQ